jgi:hypothetical protein
MNLPIYPPQHQVAYFQLTHNPLPDIFTPVKSSFLSFIFRSMAPGIQLGAATQFVWLSTASTGTDRVAPGATGRETEKQGLDVIPLKLRHAKMLGGGFHCVTLDIRRTGTLQRYFD